MIHIWNIVRICLIYQLIQLILGIKDSLDSLSKWSSPNFSN